MEIVLILVILLALLVISVLGRLVVFYKKQLDDAYEICDDWCELSKEHAAYRKELLDTIDDQHQSNKDLTETIKMQNKLINQYREKLGVQNN